MVELKDIQLIIHLSQKPEKATPLDFEWLAQLLDQYPEFDLLRKVFIQVGLKFGAKSEAFSKEINQWELKKPFYESIIIVAEMKNKIDELICSEKIAFFLKNFKPIYTPWQEALI
jgi:hypothetical protein